MRLPGNSDPTVAGKLFLHFQADLLPGDRERKHPQRYNGQSKYSEFGFIIGIHDVMIGSIELTNMVML